MWWGIALEDGNRRASIGDYSATARENPRRSGLVGLSLGCDKSPTGPTPSGPTSLSAPAALTVTSVSPSAGPTGGVDDIRVAGTGFQSGAILTLDGVAAKVTGVTSTVIAATTPVHTPGTVDVVVTNPDGQSRTLTGGYTFEVFVGILTASPSLVTSGGQLTMSWVAPSPARRDRLEYRSSGD